MWTKQLLLITAIVIAVLACYILELQQIVTEKTRRTLQLKDDVAAGDRVLITVTVTNVNPTMHQLTAQLRFRIIGDIGQDETTPKINMKLLLNNIAGPQEFTFLGGERMHRTEATFPLDGEATLYPLDHYTSTLRLLMIAPRKTTELQLPPSPHNIPEELADDFSLDQAELHNSVPIPLSISVLASIPGMKFSGKVSRNDDSRAAAIALGLRRSENLVRFSFAVMTMMMCLAIGVLSMALKATRRKTVDFLPLSWSLMLIFGLPALRNIQPGIPPVGTLGDYLSFMWAELFVASSAIIITGIWLFRSETD